VLGDVSGELAAHTNRIKVVQVPKDYGAPPAPFDRDYLKPNFESLVSDPTSIVGKNVVPYQRVSGRAG
jgi:hypothetical protein